MKKILNEDRIPDSIYEGMIVKLEDLQDKLRHTDTPNSTPEVKLPLLTLTVRDSEWLSSLIFEDVERGAYGSKITTKPASNCLEHDITLILVGAFSVVGSNILVRSSNWLIDQVSARFKNRLKSSRKTRNKNGTSSSNPKKSISFATKKSKSAYRQSKKRKEERKKKSVNYSTQD